MAKRSKLLLALDAHKGRDYEAEQQKKLMKAAKKRTKSRTQNGEDEKEPESKSKQKPVRKGRQDTSTSESGEAGVDSKEENANEPAANDDQQHSNDDRSQSDDDGKENGEEHDSENRDNGEEDEAEGAEEEDDDDDDIPLSELSDEDREDIVPHQRLTINNSAAITASIKRISFITAKTPFSEHNSLVSQEPIKVSDPNDDLNRELAFYKVCQSAAATARSLLKKEGIPFTRPSDYFSEMVKTDEHMGKIKEKLFDEAVAKKAAADARRQRDLKKFGKQVQVAKLQQRQKEKRETLEKINALKKKRKADSSAPTDDAENLFDIAIEEAGKFDSRKRTRSGGEGGPSTKRQKKDQKYGFGGKKRFSKSGDAVSSGDLRSFSVKKMKMKAGSKKLGPKRPGKSKRVAAKRRA